MDRLRKGRVGSQIEDPNERGILCFQSDDEEFQPALHDPLSINWVMTLW
jgi:hypothetical protein